MTDIQELTYCHQLIRKFLLIFYIPICLLVLYCAVYSTYLTAETWNCSPNSDLSISNNKSLNTTTNMKCYTIIDDLSRSLTKFITQRKVLLVLRTVSFYNTLLTYLSACFATYRLYLFPLLWLSIASFSSFFLTLRVCLIFGPLSGINNFELVPVFLGLHIEPYLMTEVVLAIDLIIAVLALSMAFNIYSRHE